MRISILLFLLFPIFSFAQKTDTVLFKGAKKILIETSVSSKDGMRLVTQSLMENGFIVDMANVDVGIIRTEKKKVGTFGVQIIDVLSKDNQITISSRARATLFDDTSLDQGDFKEFVTVSYLDKKMIKSIFFEMTKIAKSLKSPFVYSD